MNRWLIACVLLACLAALALAAELFLPYRPTTAEALAEVSTLRGRTAPYGVDVRHFTAVQAVDRVPRTVLVVAHYQEFRANKRSSHCAMLGEVTRYWLRGVQSRWSGHCLAWPFREGARSMAIEEARPHGTYALTGVVVDERLASVRGQWSDGHVESVPVMEETFLFFREEDDLHIEWVVGVDAEGRELPETRMDNR